MPRAAAWASARFLIGRRPGAHGIGPGLAMAQLRFTRARAARRPGHTRRCGCGPGRQATTAHVRAQLRSSGQIFPRGAEANGGSAAGAGAAAAANGSAAQH